MHCPVDSSKMLTADFGGYPIHRCSQCSGVAINGNLLREVRAHVALALHRQQGDIADARPCPADGKAMLALDYKGVVLCICPHCREVWLDADQLSRLRTLVAPPRQADLSKIGQSLPMLGSSADLTNIEDLGDILRLVVDVCEAIGTFVN